MEFKDREFIPVLLGGDINTYSVARAFYEQYQVKTYIFGKFATGPSYGSKIIEYHPNPKIDTDDYFLQTVNGFAKKHKDKKLEKAESQALAAALEEAKRLEQKLKEAQDAHLRTLAEYENYRKRTAKEKDNIYPDAVCSTAAAFLPVMDAFERAMSSPCSDPDFFKGMNMILTQFQDVLQHLEIQPVGEEGEPFDPEKHNAVMHVEDDSLGENLVVQVFQKGYVRGDKVLRHAMVKVAN